MGEKECTTDTLNIDKSQDNDAIKVRHVLLNESLYITYKIIGNAKKSIDRKGECLPENG